MLLLEPAALILEIATTSHHDKRHVLIGFQIGLEILFGLRLSIGEGLCRKRLKKASQLCRHVSHSKNGRLSRRFPMLCPICGLSRHGNSAGSEIHERGFDLS